MCLNIWREQHILLRKSSKVGFVVFYVTKNVNGILNEVFLLLEQNLEVPVSLGLSIKSII